MVIRRTAALMAAAALAAVMLCSCGSRAEEKPAADQTSVTEENKSGIAAQTAEDVKKYIIGNGYCDESGIYSDDQENTASVMCVTDNKVGIMFIDDKDDEDALERDVGMLYDDGELKQKMLADVYVFYENDSGDVYRLSVRADNTLLDITAPNVCKDEAVKIASDLGYYNEEEADKE